MYCKILNTPVTNVTAIIKQYAITSMYANDIIIQQFL